MAAADYRLCDVCGGKVFYDSNLNYESPNSWNGHRRAFRNAGEPQFDTDEKVKKWGMKLDYLGDWAVICNVCALSHKTIVVSLTDQNKGSGNG